MSELVEFRLRRFVSGIGKAFFKRLDARMDLGELMLPTFGVFKEIRRGFICHEFLAQMPDSGLSFDDHCTGIRIDFSGDEGKYCAFSCTVGTDKPDSFAVVYLEGNIVKNLLCPVSFAYLVKNKHLKIPNSYFPITV